jgi:hypothetical protein
MFKFFSTVATLMVIVLIATGIVDIQINKEKIAEVSNNVLEFSKNKTAMEQVRDWGVNTKRNTEQWVIKDEAKKIELALLYVQKDTERLNDFVDDVSQSPDVSLPQAKLLLQSINRVKDLSEELSIETITSTKPSSKEALLVASESLNRILRMNDQYEGLQKKFIAIIQATEKQIGNLGIITKTPEVAGAQDKKE